MQKYKFIQTENESPINIPYGDLGLCQLMCNIENQQLCVLKLAPIGQALKDIKFLTCTRHKNILKVLEYFPYDDSIAIVFEYLNNGDLATRIKLKQVKKNQVPEIFKTICSVLKEVHSKNAFAKTLKPDNILLDEWSNPKVIDFGLSGRLVQQKTQPICYNYMSPEQLTGSAIDFKTDIWSLGVILHELIFDILPFQGATTDEVLRSINRFDYHSLEGEKSSVRYLIKRMISVDPLERPTIQQILGHSYVKETRKQIKSLSHKLSLRPSSVKCAKQIIGGSAHRTKHKREVKMQKQKPFLENTLQMLKIKMDAFLDCQKIQENPHYNFIPKF